MNYYKPLVDLVPLPILKIIIEEDHIGKAINSEVTPSSMEYLFDVYEEFIDKNGEHENWFCYKCRQAVLDNWIKMEPLIRSLIKI